MIAAAPSISQNSGEAHGNAKLTPDAVRAIRARMADRVPYVGEPIKSIASDFGVTMQCICHIAAGRRWKIPETINPMNPMKQKRGPGRPKLPASQRAQSINFRLRPETMELLRYRAKRENLSMAKFVAQLIGA